MKNEWGASSGEMIILYGRPCSSVSSPGTRSPEGYSNSQLHFLARTRISVAPSAAVAFLMYELKPTWKRTPMKIVGVTVQKISRRLKCPVGSGFTPGFRLYFTMKYSIRNVITPVNTTENQKMKL